MMIDVHFAEETLGIKKRKKLKKIAPCAIFFNFLRFFIPRVLYMSCKKIKKSFKNLEIEIFRNKKVNHLKNALLTIFYKYYLSNPHNCFGRWLLHHTLFNIILKETDPVIPDKRSFDELKLLISSSSKNKKIDSHKLTKQLTDVANIMTNQIINYKTRNKLELNMSKNENDKIITFQVNDDKFTISEYIYNKLLVKFNGSKCKHNNELYVNIKILQLIIRYSNLESPNGRNFQGALPDKVFKMLRDEANCNFETFAAPQFSYYDKCCSAYYDTDKYFGSVGTFTNFNPNEGTYEGAPPNSEYFLNHIINHLLDIFKNATGKLCFILFLPDWDDLEGLKKIESSKYITNKFLFKQKSQIYESKNFNGKSILSIIPNSSRLYILQKNNNVDGELIYNNIKKIYKEYSERYKFEYHYDCSKFPWLNYDLLQEKLIENDKFIMTQDNAIIKPLPQSTDILNYIQNIDNISIKSKLYSNKNFIDITPPDTFLVEQWNVIGEPKKDNIDFIYFVKPSWNEIGGGFGIQIFENFYDAKKFINQQKKLVTDNIILAELNAKMSLDGYSKYSVPDKMRKLTLDKNRNYEMIYPEFYYFSAIQREIIPDLYNGCKYDIRAFLLMWYCNGKINNIYVLKNALMRVSIEKYLDSHQGDIEKRKGTTNLNIMITTNDLHAGKTSESQSIDITDDKYDTLRKFIKIIGNKIKNHISPFDYATGYGYLGIDLIKSANGTWYLLEVNEHPYFRPIFRKNFFSEVIDLAIIPAITCKKYERNANNFLTL